jgi:hypothetical protein
MATMYSADGEMVHPVKMGNMGTEQMAAALVIGALVFLIAINRGFRGVSVGKVTGGMLRG